MRRLVVAALWFAALGSLAHAEIAGQPHLRRRADFRRAGGQPSGRRQPQDAARILSHAGPGGWAWIARQRANAVRSKTYVVSGDAVIVAPQTVPGFVCAVYIDRRGRPTEGWLPSDTVDLGAVPSVEFSDWLGEWKYYNSTIAIARGKAPGSLQLHGDSFVKKLNSSANVGDFSAETPPSGHTLDFADAGGKTVPFAQRGQYDCGARFSLIDKLLVVSESGNCGGQGVNFTSFYRRAR